jgi:hypothetical protein
MERSAGPGVASIAAEVDRLVDEYRGSCLWYLQKDFYPRTEAARLRVLQAIERHGDQAAFRRARQLRLWLSQSSSAPSVEP